MKMIDHGVVAVTVICVLLGAIVGIQFKTVRNQQSNYEVQRVSELTAKLNDALAEKDNLAKALEENKKKMSEYEKYFSEDNEAIKLILDENNKYRMRAGLSAVYGKGITVTINDSKKAGQAGETGNIDAFLIHAEDILSILNELNVAGAEAMSINGQRIVSNSAVRCVGSVVNINEVKIAAPFVISVIGEPDVLESALNFPGGVADSLRPWGIELTVKKHEKVEIPAYNQKFEFKAALPVT